MMAENIDDYAAIGQAVTANQAAVSDSIQRLRAQAYTAGALRSNQQQTVVVQQGPQTIYVIQPANPQVVYVPQYNPTTVYVQHEDNSGNAAAAAAIGFTAGIVMGAAVNNSYYSPYGWGGGGYMYNDAWDDYYDNREDAREDWQDHREDLADERGDRAENAREQRTDRTDTRSDTRTDRSGNRTEAAAQTNRASGTSYESRGHSGDRAQTGTTTAKPDRSGTRSDAFSGYSSGKSERAASSRGSQSRSSSSRSRSGGGGRRK
jgi:hypothetical protein